MQTIKLGKELGDIKEELMFSDQINFLTRNQQIKSFMFYIRGLQTRVHQNIEMDPRVIQSIENGENYSYNGIYDEIKSIIKAKDETSALVTEIIHASVKQKLNFFMITKTLIEQVLMKK